MKSKRFRLYLVVCAGLLAALWTLGPREPANLAMGYEQIRIGSDVEAYLAAREKRFNDIIAGVQKKVIWANKPRVKTPLSIVYLHGFTATSKEIRPVPEKVAAALGANLYFARLTGHGRGSNAMADVSVSRWMRDVGEALKIGSAIGERVIIMGTSTGGTLAAAMAHDETAMTNIAGLIFISPNFAIKNKAAPLLTWPFARHWVPLVIGDWQRSVPRSDLHARYWTTNYPTIALMPMAALVKAVNDLDFTNMDKPALFYYSPKDQVVVAEKTAKFAREWGGPKKSILADLLPSDDAFAHIITGDIVSPGQTQIAIDQILAWLRVL